MTWYLAIRPINEPHDVGLDDYNRIVLTFDNMIEKVSSTNYAREVAKILEDASVGTFGTDIFISSKTSLPSSGTVLVVIPGGGTAPRNIHNQTLPAYLRPSVRITVYGETYLTANTMIQAAYNALCNIVNTDVTV